MLNANLTLEAAIARFGADAKAKLSNAVVSGEPEDQLRAPLENLLNDLAELCRIPREALIAVGESSLTALRTRPDYAITVHNALVGFIEVKAPGKGANPKKFKDRHDKTQWEKLASLPNLVYTDGNEFSLWRNGELVDAVVTLDGDIETSGAQLQAPPKLLRLFDDFFQWTPIPPTTPKQLAEISARLCRLLRDEVTEQMEKGSIALTGLATDWRRLLFPDATDRQFADGYAQAVTFGMLMARAREIELSSSLDQAAQQLEGTNSLIGAALRLLVHDAQNQQTLKTSLGTLTRVLDSVHWGTISKGDPDAWLYFYEDFLEVYDNDLRKLTGSYYTPSEVVNAMVRLVDETLRSRFALRSGLAATEVTIADPAVGTGTFLLGILRRIADTVAKDEGEGAVAGAVNAAVERLIAFEIQLGPFAVAQLRLLAELVRVVGSTPTQPLRMFVTDTLSNPYLEEEYIPTMVKPIAESRKQANKIKKDVPIMVVIGNPPYKDKAKGRGGWVESGSENSPEPAPLSTWMPPSSWKVGTHSKHLRNLYVYFWRWATWKVYDHHPESRHGIVCFITAAGFLNGPGFQKMRDYLRRTTDEIWVIDCSPEGHQPEVNTRVFQGVQQPICIVLASRSPGADEKIPATVRYRELPQGHRLQKFEALKQLSLESKDWEECSSEWRAPFLPMSTGAWSTYPEIQSFFVYNGSGVMPGRTWVIAPDKQSLQQRWNALTSASESQKEVLFHPHLLNGKPGDKHSRKVAQKGLPGHEFRSRSVSDDKKGCVEPTRYGFRSFDRQWIIPDNRLINRANPTLWASCVQGRQVFLTAPSDQSPTNGPALTFSGLIPDLHHYSGRGGRIIPLWRDDATEVHNLLPALLNYLQQRYSHEVSPVDFMAYIAGVAAHPGFVARFESDLAEPGLRIPITSSAELFNQVAEVGRRVIWLHTFGERYVSPEEGRPAGPPRLADGKGPTIPREGAIPLTPSDMPNSIDYDAANRRLIVGKGFIENVSPEVWAYEVSGMHVVRQWFSYRKADRSRPTIGDRRTPSELGKIQPKHWLSEYTTELLNLLHVLSRSTKVLRESTEPVIDGI